jgi:hypothetical protein
MRTFKAFAISIKSNHVTFYFLISGIIASAMLYMFFVNIAVRNAVARKNTESSILVLENKVSSLEYNYMVMQSSITLESAKSLGLAEPINKTFISSDSGAVTRKAITFNANQ